ncbi:hypothetical protein CDL15_Pgr017369 [Punica granatum]|uniref:Uncharacterized protein n=1 Tax=Punica granatum TaxID=22663 RepID=A0A218Y3R2_PUNGR|nr:hypothetical protein CDL15_Pgr017369 [Punica granatum]PKI34201.1 hypothetical protein CRG98_045409 [Punica granatum]
MVLRVCGGRSRSEPPSGTDPSWRGQETSPDTVHLVTGCAEVSREENPQSGPIRRWRRIIAPVQRCPKRSSSSSSSTDEEEFVGVGRGFLG